MYIYIIYIKNNILESKVYQEELREEKYLHEDSENVERKKPRTIDNEKYGILRVPCYKNFTNIL